MFADYHSHSFFSFDGEAHAHEMAAMAVERGLDELCFTDHLDFDLYPTAHVPDFAAREKEIRRIRELSPALTIRLGTEVSLRDESCAQRARAAIQGHEMDFILGSVHTVDGVSAWADEYYEGKTQAEAYGLYLETIVKVLPTFPELDVLGHYDFVAKYAPYPDRSMKLSYGPELFDTIFRYLIENGKSLEINTASWQQDKPWGLDILKRFRELGGEFITVGSDTHGYERIGARVKEGLALAKEAGIPYVAAFQKGKPIFHRL